MNKNALRSSRNSTYEFRSVILQSLSDTVPKEVLSLNESLPDVFSNAGKQQFTDAGNRPYISSGRTSDKYEPVLTFVQIMMMDNEFQMQLLLTERHCNN